jgi:SSS family solute:Na+ symporter
MVFNIADWLTIILYFSIVFCIGIYFARKKKNASQYFLAGRKSKWWAVGTTIFAANISTEHFIGLAGCGAAAGLAVGAYEWMAAFCLFVLGWLFVPQYLRSKVYTMPEFLEQRFSPASRWCLTIVSVLAYVFTKISVCLFAGSILLHAIAGWDYLTASLILVAATGLFTLAGGLAAVIYNDFLHVVVLIIGSVILVSIGLEKTGGFEGLRNALPADFFQMLKPASHPVYPWPGTIFGIFILGVWYWCTDQFIVQKSLSAVNVYHARAGINLTAALKILPVFLLVLPGLLARALWPSELANNPDQAYPMLITRIMPPGLMGLMIAALVGALMSALSAVFNSSATLLTMDVYRKFNPTASDKKLVMMGRFSTVAIIVVSILWIPLIRHMNNQIYQYLQSVQSYIGAPIAAVFFMGILWKGTTARAAITALVTGGTLGAFRFLLDILGKAGDFSLKGFQWLADIPFLNFSVMLFLFCIVLMIIVSRFTEASDQKKIEPLLYRKQASASLSHPLWNAVNIAVSILVAITIIGLWIHFS